jgi:hypothetical protein
MRSRDKTGVGRRDRVVYWITTSAVCGVMAFSAVNFNLKEPLGPMKGAFVHLGYPSYFRIELTAAKVLGVIAMLVPRVPAKVKEFAYFGFGITLVSASIAHYSVGDPALFVIDPLLFLGALIASYRIFRRRETLAGADAGMLRRTA